MRDVDDLGESDLKGYRQAADASLDWLDRQPIGRLVCYAVGAVLVLIGTVIKSCS